MKNSKEQKYILRVECFDSTVSMLEEDNSPLNLKDLVISNRITWKDYFFRQGAYQLNIKTYCKIIK